MINNALWTGLQLSVLGSALGKISAKRDSGTPATLEEKFAGLDANKMPEILFPSLAVAPASNQTAVQPAAQGSGTICMCNGVSKTATSCDNCKAQYSWCSLYQCTTTTLTASSGSSSGSSSFTSGSNNIFIYSNGDCSGAPSISENVLPYLGMSSGCIAGSGGYTIFKVSSSNDVTLKVLCDSGCNNCGIDFSDIAPGECRKATFQGKIASMRNALPPTATRAANGASAASLSSLVAVGTVMVAGWLSC